jgi:hypothetical protein
VNQRTEQARQAKRDPLQRPPSFGRGGHD